MGFVGGVGEGEEGGIVVLVGGVLGVLLDQGWWGGKGKICIRHGHTCMQWGVHCNMHMQHTSAVMRLVCTYKSYTCTERELYLVHHQEPLWTCEWPVQRTVLSS